MGKNTQINSKTIIKQPTQGNDATTLAANSVATTNIQDLSVTTPKLADLGVTGPKIAADGINTVLKQHKNYMINGDMRISQRGTSFVAIADSTYSLDRFGYGKVGAAVHTVTQDTDVPTVAQAGILFQNSMRLNLTTPDTSIAATDLVQIYQHVEGYNFANIAQKAFTLSFWVKATATGTYCVGFGNSGGDRSFVAEYSIPVSNTWTYVSIPVAASPSAGTWDYTTGRGLRVYWTLAAGTNFQTTAGSWQTGNFSATSNQVNGVNTGATDFRITGVMLNEGTLASQFRTFADNYADEVRACQRYLPVYRCTGGVVEALPGIATALNTNVIWIMPYPVQVRAKPTSVVVSAGSHFSFSNNNGNNASSALTHAGSGTSTLFATQMSLTITTVGGTTVPGSIYFNNAAGFIYMEGAEL